MTIPTYCTDAELKAFLFPTGYTDNLDDTFITTVNQAAARAIDAYCNQFFYLIGSPVAQTYEPDQLTLLEFGDPLGSLTGLTVKTDAAGDGTYETTWTASDYQLLPQNAASATPEPRPWTSIRAVGGKTFPLLVSTWLTRRDRVQITGLWGWPAVPATVKMANLIQGAKFFKRRDAVLAISVDTGMYVGTKLDGDVALLLRNGGYRKDPVLVG